MKAQQEGVSWKHNPQGELYTGRIRDWKSQKFYECYYSKIRELFFTNLKPKVANYQSVEWVDIRGDLPLFNFGSETCRGGPSGIHAAAVIDGHGATHSGSGRHWLMRMCFVWSLYCTSICLTCLHAVVLRASRMLIVRHKWPFRQQLVWGSLFKQIELLNAFRHYVLIVCCNVYSLLVNEIS